MVIIHNGLYSVHWTDPAVKAGRGGGRDSGRGRNVAPDGRTMGPTDTWLQVEGGKGGQPDGGRQAQIIHRTPLG